MISDILMFLSMFLLSVRGGLIFNFFFFLNLRGERETGEFCAVRKISTYVYYRETEGQGHGQ